MSKIDHTERNRSIYERRMAGETFAQISRDMKRSVARVRQIFLNEERKERIKKERESFLENASVLELPIGKCGLSVRASNCLFHQGIQTVGQMMLMDFDSAEVRRIPNFGKVSIAECKAFVAKVQAGGVLI